MSILNLNTPQGNRSGGKKSVKMWLGAGLLVAVLGIGSTLAANITLNSPGGKTEFGQGVTQTVYCGGSTSVTITPISAYQNTIKSNDTPAVDTKTATAKLFSSGSNSTSVTGADNYRVTIYAKTTSNFPRFYGSDASEGPITGYWLSAGNSTSPVSPVASALDGNSYYFAIETSYSNSTKIGTYNRSSSSSPSSNSRTVILSPGQALVPGTVTTAANFKLGGVMISDIPDSCRYKNFVISAFSETGTAKTLISSGSDVVTEVASVWTMSEDMITASKKRSTPVATPLVTAEQTSKYLQFNFLSNFGKNYQS
jgi:hypothetical protein